MFNTLKRLYDRGLIGEAELIAAVTKGWITEEQKQDIVE